MPNGKVNVLSCNMCVIPTLTAVDDAGNVGQHTSLALLDNGNPVISYVEINTALKVAVCDDPLCETSTRTTVDPSRAEYTSLALSDAGFPVISYYDAVNHDLELAICHDQTCTNPPTLKTIDSEGRQGKYSSLALNSQGFAVVSYYDETDFDLKLAVCNDAACTNPSIEVVDGTTSLVGEYTSLVLDDNGFPVISYYSLSGGILKLVTCTDATCSNPPNIREFPNSTEDVGKHTSLALSSQGFPVVSYYDDTNDDLKLLVCLNANCTFARNRVDSVGDVGRYSSLALTDNDIPIIGYFDSTNDDLKVAVCSTSTCSTSTLTTVEHLGLVGDYTSVALNSDGYPVISYYDGSPNVDLKLAVFAPPAPVYEIYLPLVLLSSQ